MIVKYIKCLVIISPVFLVACTRESNFNEIEDPSQVAAKVDNHEITVHQVQQVIQSQPKQAAIATNEEITNKVLDQLIQQELLFQQAQKMKLDRDPDAVLAIEAAKKKIIVDTYLKKVLASTATDAVTESDLQSYFNENPQYFGDRKKFTYSQIAVKVSEESKPELISIIENHDEPELLILDIEKKQFPYKHNQQIHTTEKLPKVLVNPLYTLSAGDIGYLNMDDGLLIIAVEEVEAMPISFEEARAAIKSFLYAEKQKEDIEKLVENLRDAAQIEYVGDFKPVN